MEETAALRRKWIIEECPPVKDVFDKFPCLKEPKMVVFNVLCLLITSYSIHT